MLTQISPVLCIQSISASSYVNGAPALSWQQKQSNQAEGGRVQPNTSKSTPHRPIPIMSSQPRSFSTHEDEQPEGGGGENSADVQDDLELIEPTFEGGTDDLDLDKTLENQFSETFISECYENVTEQKNNLIGVLKRKWTCSFVTTKLDA